VGGKGGFPELELESLAFSRHSDIVMEREHKTMNRMIQLLRAAPLPALLFAIAAVVLAAGCRSPNPAISRRMAAIVITNQPSEHIEAAIRTVFKRNGYEEGKGEDDEIVFQKPGSMMSGVVYSDWFNGGVWERIKIYQRELPPTETVVECDGYMVSGHEDPLFQKEKREYGTKKGHCQKLLNEVAEELRPPGR
jgi:hypothetical protein